MVSLILYAGFLTVMLDRNIEKIMIIFKFLELITYSLPAAFPIFFNLAYSFCLMRLRQDGIYGTESEKSIEGARIKTVCFDKTGTLTHNTMRLTSVFATRLNKLIKVNANLMTHPLIANLFGCCNSVAKIN